MQTFKSKEVIKKFTITTGSKREYVAQIGLQLYDRVGRPNGLVVSKTSDNFKTEGERERWISANV